MEWSIWQLVAMLVYADSGSPVEKPKDDAEAPLLTTFDGVEFPSTERPIKLIHGRASFKLKISQVNWKEMFLRTPCPWNSALMFIHYTESNFSISSKVWSEYIIALPTDIVFYPVVETKDGSSPAHCNWQFHKVQIVHHTCALSLGLTGIWVTSGSHLEITGGRYSCKGISSLISK